MSHKLFLGGHLTNMSVELCFKTIYNHGKTPKENFDII